MTEGMWTPTPRLEVSAHSEAGVYMVTPGSPVHPPKAEAEPGCVRGVWPGWEWGWIFVVMIIELTVTMANCWDPMPNPWKGRPR